MPQCHAADQGIPAAWGANLTDAPNIATGKPIRVEVSLFDEAATGNGWQGYVITNLMPSEPDRTAVYGTDGTVFYSGVNGGALTRMWGPVTALPMIMRWISDVPSKVVKLVAVRSTWMAISSGLDSRTHRVASQSQSRCQPKSPARQMP